MDLHLLHKGIPSLLTQKQHACIGVFQSLYLCIDSANISFTFHLIISLERLMNAPVK